MFPKDTRILIVDDAANARDSVKLFLKELGYTDVVESADGQAAFEVLSKEEKDKKPIQLVLADWFMPGITGLELLTLTRSAGMKMPFVMITTGSETQNVIDAVKAGANSYIVKPITGAILAQKLDAVWEKLQATGGTK